MKKIILKELFSSKEIEILLKLKPFFQASGLLSGGTSVMIQLPVRKSYDFDLFFPYEIPHDFFEKAVNEFGSKVEVLINSIYELSFISNSQFKISMIYFPFIRKYKPVVLNDSIFLSSFKDIASDKAYAIGRRPEYRDYVDLFIVLKSGFSLKQVIKDAKSKFKEGFSEKLFLSQLNFFDDIKDFTVDFIDKEYSLSEIKEFFFNETKKLIKQ
ncbi:MAG: hypothetical protein ACYCZ1_00365 [Candidatus Humimicrobiaceae bacterium]